MKKVIFGALAACLIFIAVFAGLIWNNMREHPQDTDYEPQTVPMLPTVSFDFMGYDANLLLGYREDSDSCAAAGALLPVREDGNIVLRVHTDEEAPVKTTVWLRSYDRERLIEQKELTLTGTGEMTASYVMSALTEEDTEYLLTVCLELSDGTESYYTTRVRKYPDEYWEDKLALMDFAADFSDAALSKDQDTVSHYLSFDQKLAGTDLSYVNLSSEASLVTWAGLNPVAGEKLLYIYEWSKTQITVNLCYEVDTSYEGESSSCAVEETFCVRERDDQMYLLNYERYTRESFAGNQDSVGATSILLGIRNGEDLDLLYTDYGINVYFTVDGGVWHYNYNTNEMIRVFSAGSYYRNLYAVGERFHVQLVGIENGVLYFTVTGYMVSGSHEGQNGFALYGYDIANCECQEYLYAQLDADAVSGACLSGRMAYIGEQGLFYVNLGDSIYSLDLTGSEIMRLYESVAGDTLTVSKDGSIAAWQPAEDSTEICLLDMKSGKLQMVSNGGTELEILGFINQDLVYGCAAKEHLAKEGFVFRDFFDQLVIVDKELTERASYQKEDILLCNVTVDGNGATMNRYQLKGEFCEQISDDVLFLADNTAESALVEIRLAASEVKRNYYYIALGRTVTAGTPDLVQAKLVAPKSVTVAVTTEEKTDEAVWYEAYAGGRRILSTDSAAEAIAAVFDRMGSVCLNGDFTKEIWNRDARDLYLTMTLPTMDWTQEGHEEEMAAMSSLERGVDIFAWAGVNAGVVPQDLAESEERTECDTVYQEMELLFGEHLVTISGGSISYLLYYINLRHPVLALTGENESLILTGYTSGELRIYDPATRETHSMENDEAQEYFDNLNTIFVSFW